MTGGGIHKLFMSMCGDENIRRAMDRRASEQLAAKNQRSKRSKRWDHRTGIGVVGGKGVLKGENAKDLSDRNAKKDMLRRIVDAAKSHMPFEVDGRAYRKEVASLSGGPVSKN